MNKRLPGLSLLLICLGSTVAAQKPDQILEEIGHAVAKVVPANVADPNHFEVQKECSGTDCRLTLSKCGNAPVMVKEVVLFTLTHRFPGNTKIYGEGFQMLSQTAGSLDSPVDLTGYTDRNHYRLPEPPGYRVVYNLLWLAPPGGNQYLIGFSSANRFIGKFLLSRDSIKAVIDLENLEIPAGATWNLEDLFVSGGKNRDPLFNALGRSIANHHPRLELPIPTGWCSWYCFGPEVTPKNISDNLAAIKKNVPHLKYIQLDDGYQAHMGDWMSPGSFFNGGIKEVLLKIKQQGFEPAIWVAPFICDSNSTIYRDHKDWLVRDSTGQPLRSDKVGFGGWRLAPWFSLDGTNPAVQHHLENLFDSLHRYWGCTYFKLDANYWGAIQGGRFFKVGATRTEAYRSGMTAILRGAGKDAFLLGCNQANWPSLGLVHGARTSGDISRDWETIHGTAIENLHRAWQNGKLWWNDPDCLLLTGDLPDNIFMYHIAAVWATGGMLLSGDDIPSLTPERRAILKKLSAPPGTCAQFATGGFDYGWRSSGKERTLILLNHGPAKKDFHIPLPVPVTLYDFFNGKKIGHFEKEIVLRGFPGQNGAVYVTRRQ